MIHLQVAVVMMLSCGDERHDDLLMQHGATCILMKRLIREQHIKTIRSEEQDKDSLAREKLELLLSGTQTLFDPSSRLRCDRIDLLICNSAT